MTHLFAYAAPRNGTEAARFAALRTAFEALFTAAQEAQVDLGTGEHWLAVKKLTGELPFDVVDANLASEYVELAALDYAKGERLAGMLKLRFACQLAYAAVLVESSSPATSQARHATRRAATETLR